MHGSSWGTTVLVQYLVQSPVIRCYLILKYISQVFSSEKVIKTYVVVGESVTNLYIWLLVNLLLFEYRIRVIFARREVANLTERKIHIPCVGGPKTKFLRLFLIRPPKKNFS